MSTRNVYEPFPAGPDEDRQEENIVGQRALLCIDLQFLGCREGYGVFESHRRSGVSEEAIAYYLERIEESVVPNVRRLQACFRRLGHEVIHTRIQSLTPDGRDRSLEHKRLGLHAPPGSELARFLPDVEPLDGEVVLGKTASGVFVSTNMEYVLRNLGVFELYVVGVYTNECVSSAIRSASDLGFEAVLVSDATAAITPELHEATLLTTRDRYAKVMTTDQAVARLERRADG